MAARHIHPFIPVPWLSIVLGCVVLYAVVATALAGSPSALAWFGTIAMVVAAATPISVITWRRRDWIGCQRLFWFSFLSGLIAWLIAHIGWASIVLTTGREEWIGWYTVVTFTGAAAPLLALLARPDLGARRRLYAVTAIDIAGLVTLTGFVVSFFVLVPRIDPRHASIGLSSLQVVAEVQRVLLAAGMLAAVFAARDRAWRRVYIVLAAGLGCGAILRAWLSSAIATGHYHVGSVQDLAWIVPFLTYAWAAAESPASDRTEANPLERGSSAPWLIALTAAAIPALGLGVLRAWPLGDAVDSARITVTTLATLMAIALVTVRMVVQRAELRRVDYRLRLMAAATDNTRDLILITTPGGRFEDGNDAFFAATGYTREELSGRPIGDFLEVGSVDTLADLSTRIGHDGVWRGTLLRRRKDGSTFDSSCTVTALRNERGEVTHYVGVERDVSDELRLREQLVRSERLAAISEVVAGVAHEINNPLQAIVGGTELLLDAVPEAQRDDVRSVRTEALRAGQIVRNLLTFVHRGPVERRAVDVNEIVRATAAVRAYHLHQSGIELAVICHPQPVAVLANPDEIRQVLLNLVLNAEHAIAATGQPGEISISSWLDAQGASVRVADDGPGVNPRIRGRIFEPFFTTKQPGEGTGLGLSISLGIALAHGGTLVLEPQKRGTGAAFTLTLPPLAEPSDIVDIGPTRPAHGRRAIVVDDEESIRVLLARLLEKRGYVVEQMTDGAVALAEIRRAIPDLVICDAQMRKLTGPALYERAVAHDARLASRFLFVSGDAYGLPKPGGAPPPALPPVPLLRKPFTAADLDAALASLPAANSTG